MRDILFSSILDCEYQESLDKLLFFNGNQDIVSDGVSYAIEHYGVPRVSTVNKRMWVTFDSGVEAQTLYVLEQSGERPELVGVVVYTREDDELVVLFVAVHEDYARHGKKRERMLFLGILAELQEIACHVKGISSIKLFLKRHAPTRISVPKSNHRHGHPATT